MWSTEKHDIILKHFVISFLHYERRRNSQFDISFILTEIIFLSPPGIKFSLMLDN